MLGWLTARFRPRTSTHEAAATGRRLRWWLPGDAGPRREHLALPLLRARARDAVRNNPIARAAVERITTDVIGVGVTPKPRIESERLRTRMVELWEAWADEADADGQTDLYGLQTLAFRSMIESGECLAVFTSEPAAGIPLRVRLLESDHLARKTEMLAAGRRIVDGIELDAQGRRVAYWLHPRHPGDGDAAVTNDPVRVPAARVVHLFEATRPGQLRGVPWLAGVLVRLKMLDEFQDAQLHRIRIANLFTGFIRRPPVDPIRPTLGPDGAPLNEAEPLPPLSLEPGMMQELMPGEDVTFSTPPGTTAGYTDMVRALLREVSSALGVPYPVLTGDFADTNDRVARIALNEYRRRAQQLIHNTMVPKFCAPIRAAWIDAAVLAGLLPSDKSIRATRWTPHGWPYLHPVQEVQADILAIDANLKSRSEALMERGFDAELLDREIAADLAREQALGIARKSR